MSSRTRSRSAYESSLNGSLNNSATSFDVNSATGLSHPLYLVIDPDDGAKREFILVGNVTGSTLSSVTRGLAGSAAGPVAHDDGAVIRAVLTHLHLDDIFDDIETLETDVAALEAADTGHFGGTDSADHPEATTSVRGFLSAVDKIKLNALDTTKQVTNGDSHDHSGGDGAAITGIVTNGNSHDHAGGDGAQIAHSGLSGLTTGDPHTQYRLESADHNHGSGGAQGGLVSHSVLNDLTTDDHAFYPKGVLGYAEITSDIAGIDTIQDLAGLSAAVTVGAGRYVRVTAYVGASTPTVSLDRFQLMIREGSTQLGRELRRYTAASAEGGFHVAWVGTPSPGAHTYKLTCERAAGTGTLTLEASATEPCFILVEDIGPT